jgi:hypothetical protein
MSPLGWKGLKENDARIPQLVYGYVLAGRKTQVDQGEDGETYGGGMAYKLLLMVIMT